jgi:hypothetical protein
MYDDAFDDLDSACYDFEPGVVDEEAYTLKIHALLGKENINEAVRTCTEGIQISGKDGLIKVIEKAKKKMKELEDHENNICKLSQWYKNWMMSQPEINSISDIPPEYVF